LADGLVRLLLGCAEDPIDPGFEIVGSAFQEVLIRVNPDMLTVPENMPSDTRILISLVERRPPRVTDLSQRLLAHATTLVVEGLWFG
jgi:hypothetical protein